MENKEKLFNYPYAKDDNGKPISITEIKKETRHNSHYYCYGCEAELFPVLGNIREHHFRHEKGSICDPNKYLHEFAKATIKKRFDENEHFIVKYYAHHKCKKIEDCNLFKQYHWSECEWDGFNSIDLKQYYDTCTPEKGYYQDLPNGKKKYIADLILSNSQKSKSPPTSLEVWVTHECTEDKKLNGGRIIELKISKEQDVFREIIENNNINLPIRFFNFKREVSSNKRKIFKHIMIKDKKIEIYDSSCSDGLKYDQNREYEIIISTNNTNNHWILLSIILLNKKGYSIPEYQLCEYGYVSGKYKCCKHNFPNLPKNNSNPCHECKLFKYSPNNGNKLMENFKNIPFWEFEK